TGTTAPSPDPSPGGPDDPSPSPNAPASPIVVDGENTAGAAPAASTQDRTRERTGPSGSVEVEPGDSLWSIAAEHLGTADPGWVAREWPRWYEANRATIGADPDLIRPGQVLHAPAEDGADR
ncbi:LysM peptidoglycan-binding domain-containing protein, partial [Actinotalea sp.]|uniref:LysM peptidoglycan-binding domain-containing protein n=1 Tax=Actinotalea sp. TaxID=1872145 RepID=UPI00356B0133